MDEDREFLRRCWEGDRAACRDLVRRYQGMVYGLATRALRSKDEAQDAAQEVFLNVLRSIPFFRGDCTVKTWIYRIAVNECIARSKRQRRRERHVRRFDDGEEAGISLPQAPEATLDHLVSREETRRVRAAIDELPEKYRMAILLRYFDGLAYEETAEVLQIPLNTLKVWLFRAKGLLRGKLVESERGSAA